MSTHRFPLVLPALVAVGLLSTGTQQVPVRRGTVDLELGQSTSGGPFEFGRVSGVDFDSNGRIFVADELNNEIRAFSPSGHFLWKTGRAGDGPGELRRPCCVVFDTYGRLWVLSLGARANRLDVFDVQTVGSRHTRRINLSVSPVRHHPLLGSAVSVAAGEIRDGDNWRLLVHLDSTGKERQRVRIHNIPEDSLGSMTMAVPTRDGAGRVSVQVPPPFGPRPLFAYGHDSRVAYALSSRYVIQLFDGSGNRTFVIRGGQTATSVTDQERDIVNRAQNAARDSARRSGATYPTFAVPRQKPPLRSIFFDTQGRLWVELTRSFGDRDARAHVYDERGQLLFTAVWPADVSLADGSIRGFVALGIRKDEFDVDRVVRVRFR